MSDSPERAVPYHCPFCAEEDLRPVENGRWHCRACTRLFSVQFFGLSSTPYEQPKPDLADFRSDHP